MTAERLGISGAIAKKFLHSEITPLLALVGLLMGVFTVLVTPREEEPQIDVTFANVFIPFPGATATEVERVVSGPAEQILAEITGVKHVFSVSQPGMAVLSVQFKVGEPRTEALVRLYNKIYSNQDFLPPITFGVVNWRYCFSSRAQLGFRSFTPVPKLSHRACSVDAGCTIGQSPAPVWSSTDSIDGQKVAQGTWK